MSYGNKDKFVVYGSWEEDETRLCSHYLNMGGGITRRRGIMLEEQLTEIGVRQALIGFDMFGGFISMTEEEWLSCHHLLDFIECKKWAEMVN
jgi:hypothetical protein